MKFYNPFKPHIVLDPDGYYYIRRFRYLWWQYLWCHRDGKLEYPTWCCGLHKDYCNWWHFLDSAKEKLVWLNSYRKPKTQVILE